MTSKTPRNPRNPRNSPKPPAARRLVVLGSTGSIGVNTLAVVDHLNQTGEASVEIVGLAAGRNAAMLIEQARRFGVRHLAVSDPQAAQAVADALPDATVFTGGPGQDAPQQLVEAVDATDLSAAIVGAAGLPATVTAIEKGMNVQLANKETLVAAGELVAPLVAKHGVALLPVDSEHSAIFQCLHQQPQHRVKRIILTASGGPFRTWTRDRIQLATVEEALNHPTWNMGRKITIDSASMMNKALEIIEAHWLFNLPGGQISVIVHPQSVVHSAVEFEDHSILAQMGPPDMKTPIQYALTYPDRPGGCSAAMDWAGLSKLTFEQPDFARFPSLRLAYEVIAAGGTAGATFNAANEAAVDAFLSGRVRFGQIFELVEHALESADIKAVDAIETVLEADRRAREQVYHAVEQTRTAAGA